jgi:hypothetical protein
MDKPQTDSVYGVGCEMCIISNGGGMGVGVLPRTDGPVRYGTVQYNTIRSGALRNVRYRSRMLWRTLSEVIQKADWGVGLDESGRAAIR